MNKNIATNNIYCKYIVTRNIALNSISYMSTFMFKIDTLVGLSPDTLVKFLLIIIMSSTVCHIKTNSFKTIILAYISLS